MCTIHAVEQISRKMCHRLVKRFITLLHILTLFPDTQVLKPIIVSTLIKIIKLSY